MKLKEKIKQSWSGKHDFLSTESVSSSSQLASIKAITQHGEELSIQRLIVMGEGQ